MESWEVLGTLKKFSQDVEIDPKGYRIVKVEDIPTQLQKKAQTEKQWNKYVCEGTQKDYYLLEAYGSKYWICWSLQDFDSRNLSEQQTSSQNAFQDGEVPKDWFTLQLPHLFNLWKEVKSASENSSPINLDMSVPYTTDGAYPNLSHGDPKIYFETKYYESLFFINMPLAYFVKSNLSRFKNICKNTYGKEVNILYQSTLLKYLLRITEFDKRHEGEGLLKEHLENNTAQKKQKALLNRYSSLDKNVLRKNLSSILKIREIKLQIVILLEAISLNNLDDNFINYEDRYGKRLKKRSINVAKNWRPTMKKASLCNEEGEKEPVLDYCEQLDLYLDKLCIQDILLASEPVKPDTEGDAIEEHKKSILNKNKENSSIGFAGLVLIPYYSKKAPNAVQFIMHKLKGPNLKGKRPIIKRDIKSPNCATEDQVVPLDVSSPSSRISSTPSTPSVSLAGYRRRTPFSNHAPELVNSRTASNLNSLFESTNDSFRKPSSILRTSSDLTMNHLQKRQLAVADLSSQGNLLTTSGHDFSSTRSFNSGASKMTSLTQNSFRRVGKRKDASIHHTAEEKVNESTVQNVVQVESTPLKKSKGPTPKRAKLLNIVESPINTSRTTQTALDIECDPNVSSAKGKKSPPKKNIKRRLFAP